MVLVSREYSDCRAAIGCTNGPADGGGEASLSPRGITHLLLLPAGQAPTVSSMAHSDRPDGITRAIRIDLQSFKAHLTASVSSRRAVDIGCWAELATATPFRKRKPNLVAIRTYPGWGNSHVGDKLSFSPGPPYISEVSQKQKLRPRSNARCSVANGFPRHPVVIGKSS